jgi:hypothetical protein
MRSTSRKAAEERGRVWIGVPMPTMITLSPGRDAYQKAVNITTWTSVEQRGIHTSQSAYKFRPPYTQILHQTQQTLFLQSSLAPMLPSLSQWSTSLYRSASPHRHYKHKIGEFIMCCKIYFRAFNIAYYNLTRSRDVQHCCGKEAHSASTDHEGSGASGESGTAHAVDSGFDECAGLGGYIIWKSGLRVSALNYNLLCLKTA